MPVGRKELQIGFANASIVLSEQHAELLSLRCSSLEAAFTYYFENSHLFSESAATSTPSLPSAASREFEVSPEDHFTSSLLDLGVILEVIENLRRRFSDPGEAYNFYLDNPTACNQQLAPPRPPDAVAYAAAPRPQQYQAASAYCRNCPACAKSFASEQMYTLNGCSHSFCYSCLCRHLSGIIIQQSKMPHCLAASCAVALEPGEIRQVVDLSVAEAVLSRPDAEAIKTKTSTLVQRQLAEVQTRLERAQAGSGSAATGTERAVAAFEEGQLSRIKVAVVVMVLFLRNVMGADDRCSIVAFNEEYLKLVTLKDEANAIAALAYCITHCSGGTRLWDSITVSVGQFFETADRGRPWILIILTDGDDRGSTSTLAATSAVLQRFNAPPDNFAFVIGLGKEINPVELQQMCKDSGSLYLAAENAKALEALFALIALQVVEGIAVDLQSVEREGAKNVFERVTRARRAVAIGRKSVDFLMLVDISGSMNLT